MGHEDNQNQEAFPPPKGARSLKNLTSPHTYWPGDPLIQEIIEAKLDAYSAAEGVIDLSHLRSRSRGAYRFDFSCLKWIVQKLEELSGLHSLEFSGNGIGPDGAEALAASNCLSNLRTLKIGNNQIDDRGAAAIARHLTGLTTLNIKGNSISEIGIREIGRYLTKLVELDISGNYATLSGAIIIANELKHLKSLDISRNSIFKHGAILIARQLTKLTSLSVWDNGIGDDGWTSPRMVGAAG